jgi:hypothetical protein
MKLLFFTVFLVFLKASCLWGLETGKAVEKAIEVFPSAPFYQFTIYESLVIFWIAIIGLLVIIGMKLREIERLQRMGLDKDER